ncbi:membrane or secreted protein [Zunongwangia profunda SM-A87]|uniref:Membrane or secreted protein n=1 Tax=Zunongwangia profunda (strain DSM 18752 / CCTCC AB 206139 / SM-A87) TaxID=655815 RepID=D5BA97_ZUNPS|nr:hypothetical protein [Zunongwangia profunda]ADF54423.1 membrane or secreted protein [Zunongwangia profunda SM-A87]
MKKIAVFSLVVLFLSCAEKQNLSPSETAKIVAESFYHGDKATLKEYTTESGYSNLSSVQEMFTEDKNSEPHFKVVDEQKEGEVTWIKYSTSFDPKPGVYKLIKEDGLWKVTHNGPRDKGPF